MWIDSSLAEVHSLTLLLMALALFLAVRFDRTGERKVLVWLAVVFGQGVFHGRSVVGLLPAIGLLVVPRWRMIWRNALLLIGVGLILPPLLYLYLPLREWMGSDWTFGNTSTWEGFLRMFLNIKAARYARLEEGLPGWRERLTATLGLLNDDLPLVLHGIGVIGLVSRGRARSFPRYAAALVLGVLPYVVVPIIIYKGFVGDAILAVKVPVSLFTGLGLALLVSRLQDWLPKTAPLVLALSMLALVLLVWRNHPNVVAITGDRSVETPISIADQAAHPERPTVLMILWGHNYWGAAYAQEYRGQLEGVTLVDHNAPFDQIVAEGNVLITLSETFNLRPVEWWEEKLGPVYLRTYAPGLIEIRTEPRVADMTVGRFRVNDDLSIASCQVEESADGYSVRIRWVAETTPARDYSVAVHLVSADPPAGPDDILAQADSLHPVEGWYPTTRWTEGQMVRGMYRLPLSPAVRPVAILITAYYVDEDGQFVNGEWLSVHLK